MRRLAHTAAMTALLTAASACGAKTGLPVPDVTTVADVPDVTDVFRPPRCTDGQFTLTPRAADVMLVIDRSGSMSESLTGGVGTAKWELLRDALGQTLPRFQSTLQIGALFFPDEGVDPRGALTCALANVPSVDVEPALGTANSILSIFRNTEPSGATPTAAALLRAHTYFARHPNRAHSRSLVLATDGGPNCNPSLDPTTCVCANAPGTVGCGPRQRDGNACLDDVRTVSEISQIATNPIEPMPTFVIGLAGHTSSVYSATLTAMAIAGGRPNLGTDGRPTFYNVEQPSDLINAFTNIQNAIARCSFLTPSRPDNPDALTLTMDGVPLTRDPMHLQGWDWTDQTYGEVTLFGAACASATARTPVLIATVTCSEDAGR